MLSDLPTVFGSTSVRDRLNAPYGARCFLTRSDPANAAPTVKASLNAPYGARCFLTRVGRALLIRPLGAVLMHLMALGAF